MREKIAKAMCPKKDPELNCDDCIQELVCKPRIKALEALFTAEQKQWEEDLIDYLNYRLSEYTKKEHLFEVIKKWRD